MQAAAPYIDDLLPVNNLAALLDLAAHLNSLSQGRPRAPPADLSALRRPQPLVEAAAAAPQQRSWHAGANPTFRHPMWGRGEPRNGA